MTQNCFKLICRSSSTEIFNRDGLLPLYFNIEIPEPFARETIPQASIIVSWTWKLQFTSNSISRSRTGLWMRWSTSLFKCSLSHQVDNVLHLAVSLLYCHCVSTLQFSHGFSTTCIFYNTMCIGAYQIRLQAPFTLEQFICKAHLHMHRQKNPATFTNAQCSRPHY